MILPGCGRPPAEPKQTLHGSLGSNVVARVGDVLITREALEEVLARSGRVRDKDQALQELIEFQAALSKARAAGIDRDPELRERFEKMIVGKFQEEELAKRATADSPVTDEEIASFYQAHQERYRTPASVRAGVIYLKSSPKALPEKLAEMKAKAETVLAAARSADGSGWSQLARLHSDDQATRYRGGDAGWMWAGQPGAHWTSNVVHAAFALNKPGELAPLIETEHGFYVVRLIGKKPEAIRPLEEEKAAIRYELAREKKRRRQREFLEEVKRGPTIEINQPLLKSIPDPAPKPTTQPPGLPRS
jgi:parvulin-like peptidyl-prolyl isomerase